MEGEAAMILTMNMTYMLVGRGRSDTYKSLHCIVKNVAVNVNCLLVSGGRSSSGRKSMHPMHHIIHIIHIIHIKKLEIIFFF